MAKRKRPQKESLTLYDRLVKYQPQIIRGLWIFVVLICFFYGYTKAAPIIATGELWNGLLIGFAYGMGALLAVLAAFFFNQKLRGRL
jgi:VIT1/CCC1 family predicted Fe2+/Mn2+ transporter